jgi:hypothetical protein
MWNILYLEPTIYVKKTAGIANKQICNSFDSLYYSFQNQILLFPSSSFGRSNVQANSGEREKFDCFSVLIVQTTVFFVVTARSPVGEYRRFKGI